MGSYILCTFTLLSILSLVKMAQSLLEISSNLEGFKYGLQTSTHRENCMNSAWFITSFLKDLHKLSDQ